MSFKYRFILSFVLLEVFFIVLIVTTNFIAIRDSSDKLIKEKIESNISFLDELVKVPISIYDLATLDNLVLSTKDLKYINSIIVLDAQNKVLTKLYEYKHSSLEQLIKNPQNQKVEFENETYEIRYKKLMEEDITLGSLLIVFDTTQNSMFISTNKNRTIMLVILEILVSTILSFFIGSKLTNMLTELSNVAVHIGEEKQIDIPYQDKKDEIGVLSKSMQQMQFDLKTRSDRLKTLAVELNKQKNELLEANEYKDNFLANMSHELKTPLNSINVISSVMMKNKKGKLEEDQVKNLSIINKCGNDLLYLINDVLDISKLEAGEMSLDMKTIDLNALMTEINDMFKPQVKQKKLNFVFDMSSDIKYVYSDDNRIKQIVKNLLSNALKFVNEGSIRLIIKDLQKDVQIIVRDDGIGIAEDKLGHIFDRFKQADGSTTRKYGGTGLGLAICKELSNLLGGDIKVESTLDVGTTFIVTLPKNSHQVDLSSIEEVKQETKTEELKAQVSVNETEVSEKKDEKGNILILNNDPITFMSIVTELKKISNVMQVSTLSDLLEKIKEITYDYVIVDLSKLELDNLESSFKNLDLNTIFICEDENSIDENLLKNSVAVMNKPIDKEELISKIKG